MIIIRLLVWLLQACKIVQSAGVAAHLTLLARTSVPSGLQPYLSQLKAGTFFPDAFYSCNTNKKWQQFSEWAHWPPFLILGSKLWQERYKNDQDCDNSKRLKAFLMGVFVHQVTDVSWHSLVSGYKSHGLIKVLAGLEFDGDYQAAHNFIDSMGDFLILGQILTDYSTEQWAYYTDQDWEFPVEDDLLELIRRSGVNDMHLWEINTCVRRGAAALASEVITMAQRKNQVLELAYGISPRARELMQDHWLGGEMNLAAMINKCLPTFLSLFENEELSIDDMATLMELCGSLPSAKKLAPVEKMSLQTQHQSDGSLFVSPLMPLSLFGSDIAVGRFQKNATSLAISAPLEETEGSVYVIPWNELTGLNLNVAEKPLTSTYGARVHAYTHGSVDYLVVSAPGENSIYFYEDGLKKITLSDTRSWERHQLSVSLIGDIDDDGIPDLILTGPRYGLNETGVVMIVDGRETVDYLRDSKEHELELHDMGTLTLKAPLSEAFQNYGSQLALSTASSVNRLLYVAAQGLGVIFAYSLRTLHQNALPSYYIIDESVVPFEVDVPLDLHIRTSSQHGMFGKEMKTWRFEGKGFVAISCHLQNKLFIYEEIAGALTFHAVLVLDTSADPKTVKAAVGFGTSLEYDDKNDRLLVSSPGLFEGTGAIWGISMIEIWQSVKRWKLTTILVTPAKHLISLNNGVSGKGIPDYGKIIKMGPDGKLLVGAPRYGYGDFGDHQLSGGIYII
ncbi:LAFA_0G05380g1_1 [Lachancea sp. 'fantastica']|nr:LAFA_0G05380g1_1 [Lachancea sp. 'fantastica']